MQLGIEKRMWPHVPWALVISVILMSLIGIWNLASASRPPHHPVWTSQLLYLGVGIVAILCVALVDIRFIQRMVIPIYLINIGLLLGLKIFGHRAKGAESWFAIGPFRLQPAEFMKIGLVLMLAKFFHDDYRPQDSGYGFGRLIIPMVVSLVPLGLVLVQPDLGTALMMFFTALTVILFGRVKLYVTAVLLVGILGSTLVLWNDYVREQPGPGPRKTIVRHFLKKHQDGRISGWLNPESDQRGTNYHATQSKIAVGSGGLTGKGWMKGTQTGLYYLPEQHTDFIFSVWAEEHGFLSSLGLLFLYGMVLMLSLGVAFNARDRFGAFVAVGIAAMIFWQVFENIGMVTGLLPVTGITLPLLTYGGSSMLSTMIGVGLLVNISMRRHMF
jgi:rod shape determining protein RodA